MAGGYSGVAPDAFTALPHLMISALMKAVYSSGLLATTSAPALLMRLRNSGCAAARATTMPRSPP